MRYALQDMMRSFEIILVEPDHTKISKCLEVPFHQYCESKESQLAKFLEELGRKMFLGIIQRLSQPSFGSLRHELWNYDEYTDFIPQYPSRCISEGLVLGLVSEIKGRNIALVLDCSGNFSKIQCSEILLEEEFDILEPESLKEGRVQMTGAFFFSLNYDNNWLLE